MQPGCDEIEFLISKSVDGEATPEERALVDSHIAGCDSCACKLISFMEMAAVFSEAPLRAPDPQVRSGVFTEITRLKEAERRAEEARIAPSKPAIHYIPGPFPTSPRTPARRPSIGSRLWSVGSPFAVMGTAVAVVIVIMTLAAPPEVGAPIHVATATTPVIPDGVGTKSVSSIQNEMTSGGIPSPVGTQAASTYRVSTVSATVRSTATFLGDTMLELSDPTAILESGDPNKVSDWHIVRDPAFGYSISYPPNWWTQVVGVTRYFYPWGLGGVKYAPYSIEFLVQDNPHGYTAETANDAMFMGACKLETGISGKGKCLRRNSFDDTYSYDELYVFDPNHIYLLRTKVPLDSSLGDFQVRLHQSQDVLARMSGSILLAPQGSAGTTGYGPVIFLNGSDLWAANTGGSGARPVTHGYSVRQFALSSDLRHVAFTANDPSDRFADAHYIYISDAEGDGALAPQLLDASLTVFDIAWYSDRALLAIAKDPNGLFGIYTLPVDLPNGSITGSIEATPQLLLQLSGDMTAARGLAVSPDRQLITFLAPLGEAQGTDIYALRPDSSDLRKIVSHTDPVPPTLPTPPRASTEDALTQDNQAIKSYAWLDGKLENGNYYLDMLFTSGTFKSSTLYRGGFLYSASSAGSGTILDPSRLNVEDPDKVQIVSIAYSPAGKVAFTGFYMGRDNWVEVLAGLWTADIVGGNLVNLVQQPIPASPDGISDLQWTPDGTSLIYRETIPRDPSNMVSRYTGEAEFKLIHLDPQSGQQNTLYDTTNH